MASTRRLDKIGKAGKIDKAGKTRKTSKAATLALLTAALFGGATSEAAAQERGLAVVAKNRIEAILVGVDEYASRNVETLTYAGADAKKLRDALAKIGVPEESVRLFVSRGGLRERPDKATIMAALDEAVENSGPNSTVLVALSGHGFETPDGEAAFCPEDAKISVSGGEVYVDKNSAILISEVAEKLRSDDAKFKLLIVDACRAPAGARTTRGRRSFVTGDASGLAFLQSCSSGESSWEDESVAGGLFTHYFVEGLTGAAADEEGGVSFLGVCDYAARRTKARARALRNASQTPFHRMSGTNFYLVEPSGTRSGGNATASAATLFTEAFQAFSAKEYATARKKCEASLAASGTEAEKAAARNLLAMIEQAQKQTGGTPGTQTSTAQWQPQRPTSQPSQTQTASNSNAASDEESYPGDWSDAPKAGTLKSLEVDGITYNFRYCPAGTFQMGSPESESGHRFDETQHRVTLDGFWMLETEVTVGMWRSFVKATNYKMGPGYKGQGGYSYNASRGKSNFSLQYTWENPGFPQTDAHPVTEVDWAGTVAFCEWLSKETGLLPRLPSEAEWEYACRAGSTTAYSFGANGEDLTKYENVADASSKGKFSGMTVAGDDGYVFTAPVKQFKPNAWKLYDMHGNVEEWCADWYANNYYKEANNSRNPINTTESSARVVRGGSWENAYYKHCRSASRNCFDPTMQSSRRGFRLVLGRER